MTDTGAGVNTTKVIQHVCDWKTGDRPCYILSQNNGVNTMEYVETANVSDGALEVDPRKILKFMMSSIV